MFVGEVGLYSGDLKEGSEDLTKEGKQASRQREACFDSRERVISRTVQRASDFDIDFFFKMRFTVKTRHPLEAEHS